MAQKSFEQMAGHAGEAADFLKKLVNPSRLMVLCALSDGEQSVSQLNERVELSQSALSQHLAALREASLVTTRREGQTIYYNLQGDQAIEVIKVLQALFCKS